MKILAIDETQPVIDSLSYSFEVDTCSTGNLPQDYDYDLLVWRGRYHIEPKKWVDLVSYVDRFKGVSVYRNVRGMSASIAHTQDCHLWHKRNSKIFDKCWAFNIHGDGLAMKYVYGFNEVLQAKYTISDELFDYSLKEKQNSMCYGHKLFDPGKFSHYSILYGNILTDGLNIRKTAIETIFPDRLKYWNDEIEDLPRMEKEAYYDFIARQKFCISMPANRFALEAMALGTPVFTGLLDAAFTDCPLMMPGMNVSNSSFSSMRDTVNTIMSDNSLAEESRESVRPYSSKNRAADWKRLVEDTTSLL